MVKLLALIISIFGLSVWITIGLRIIEFNRECGGYLERAANANTVELAKDQLKIALNYLEYNKLTEGYTSVIYTTPNEDVGYWYYNLKESLKELESIDSTATSLEKSNMLLKLRETLVENNGKDSVIMPSGISRYPYNLLFAIMMVISVFCVLFGWTILFERQ